MHDALDVALEGRFPQCTLSESQAGQEFDYYSQLGFQEDYSDEFDYFCSDNDDSFAFDIKDYLSSVLGGDIDKGELKNLLEHGHPDFDMGGHLLALVEYDKVSLKSFLKVDNSGWETCSEGDVAIDGGTTDDAGRDATEPDEEDRNSAEIDDGDTDDVETIDEGANEVA